MVEKSQGRETSLLHKMSSFLIQSELIEASIGQLPPKAPFVFGACICQRIWPVFATGFPRNRGRQRDELESDLIAVWRFLAELAPSPAPISPAFEKAIPPLEESGHEEYFFESAGILYTFADSFDRGRPDGIAYVSRGTLNILDDFVYNLLDVDVTSENDVTVHSHLLVTREFKRQQADLLALSSGAGPETVLSLWERSKNESLLEGY
jgi:hypothetical protein